MFDGDQDFTLYTGWPINTCHFFNSWELITNCLFCNDTVVVAFENIGYASLVNMDLYHGE